MGLFKKWRAKRAAKKQLKEQNKNKKEQEVILKEEKVNQVKQENKDKAQSKPKYHVSQNKTASNPNFKRWGVRMSNSKKTIKYFDTQLEAIKYAEDLAKTNDTSIVIHKLDGKIRKQNY